MAAGDVTSVSVGYSGSVRANMGDYEHSDAFNSLTFTVDVTGLSDEEVLVTQAKYRALAQGVVDDELETHYMTNSKNAPLIVKKEDPE